MSTQHLEPARSVIAAMGGVEVVSQITGKHVSRVYRWMYPKEKGGTAGFIPQADAAKLLQEAPAREVDLQPVDFFSADRLSAPTELAAA